MESARTVEKWKEELEPVLESKVYEFKTIGYNEATAEDIWRCLNQKVWKDNAERRLYEVVQDVFHLSTATYMSYLTVNAYGNDDDLMASIAALTDNSS
ncbi:Post-transcriptional regulator ComN [Lentibacillus sp. JNUCC-1]|uniref:post-transcriptional regulator n=1 Tax=Lentibacillus sp. JNUCC-1 TaxID=2654513 RepID=UPI001322A8A8|nr:Post-transcriptional regulator ComN [Lentibacillus sp. JNUCC-1]